MPRAVSRPAVSAAAAVLAAVLAGCGGGGSDPTTGSTAATTAAAGTTASSTGDGATTATGPDATVTVDGGTGTGASGPRLEGTWDLVFTVDDVYGEYATIRDGTTYRWRYTFVPRCPTGACGVDARVESLDGEEPSVRRFTLEDGVYRSRLQRRWGRFRCEGEVLRDAIASTQIVRLRVAERDAGGAPAELSGRFVVGDRLDPAPAACTWKGEVKGAIVGTPADAAG